MGTVKRFTARNGFDANNQTIVNASDPVNPQDVVTKAFFTSGNAGSATILQNSRTINGIAFNGSANIAIPTLYDAAYTTILNPGGGSTTGTTASQTGAIKVTLPVGWTNTMVRMTIKIFDYESNSSFDVQCGGYNSTTASGIWVNTFAYIVSNSQVARNFQVRFGYTAGGKCCVYIGELASTWAYPQVFITDVQCGYLNMSTAWTTGWTISYESTAFETVTSTVQNTQVGLLGTTIPLIAGTASNGVSIEHARVDHVHPAQTTITGNAGSATILATGRTIGMTGDVTWTSPAFDGSGNVTAVATLAASGVTAGTYKSVTVNAKGIVTGGTNPTTLAGFGITDAGTVTSVGGTGTVSGLTLTGTVTTTGNLTLGGTLAVTPSNFASQTANTVLAAPNGSAGTPSFRTLVAADIPTITAAKVSDFDAQANASVIHIGNTEPAGNQQLWWNTDDGDMYVKYNDGTSTQWVSTSTKKSLPSAGSGIPTFCQQTEPTEPSPWIWYKINANGDVIDILKG